MNKLFAVLILTLFPTILFADGALNFSPPATDWSVVLLGNLFGVVDGVLSGSGTQMMGAIFKIFNSAVLALGGIFMSYTLIVGTMNTAHEGQMLGQKWSSIWIPVRSTLGLALLIPKSSGYCLMQVFIMWVVLQGVGAADKVWSGALSYLNRGGLIMRVQSRPELDIAQELSQLERGRGELRTTGNPIAVGASVILSGQVCMLALQKQLETQRREYLKTAPNSGMCSRAATPELRSFCDNPVPNFLASFNALTATLNPGTEPTYLIPMPNITTPPYSELNGICGQVSWKEFTLPAQANVEDTALADTLTLKPGGGFNIVNRPQQMIDPSLLLSKEEIQTTTRSRAIAVQQMYVALSPVAQLMVNNAPAFSNNSPGDKFSDTARQQFGIPFTVNQAPCATYGSGCVSWGPTTNGEGKDSATVMFRGTEFLGAIRAYNGIMTAAINVKNSILTHGSKITMRRFIPEASSRGWILAGSYFWDLVNLNSTSEALNPATQDTDSGLERSKFLGDLTSPFADNCSGTYRLLCVWLLGDKSRMAPITTLINGDGLQPGNNPDNTVPRPTLTVTPAMPSIQGVKSSTTFGFITNSSFVQAPSQVGGQALNFANQMRFPPLDLDKSILLKPQSFPCGGIFGVCIGGWIVGALYNNVIRNLLNIYFVLLQQMLFPIFNAMVILPLQAIGGIFGEQVTALSQPGINPILSLANMGAAYINFAGNLWLIIIALFVNPYTLFFALFILMALPILIGALSTMIGIAFVTSYYIPLLPYLIFTFGAIAWFIAIIEAMVAGPIIALGVTYPEGHEAFGKGEQAIMILMNVFLRPSLMIIGYIGSIALSYIGVWLLNAGYQHAVAFLQTPGEAANCVGKGAWAACLPSTHSEISVAGTSAGNTETSGTGGYQSWAALFAYFMSVITYVSTYLIIVQKSFTLIGHLPDKVLRWIGGAPEQSGAETMQWGEEVKSGAKEGGKAILDTSASAIKGVAARTEKAALKIAEANSGGGAGGASMK